MSTPHEVQLPGISRPVLVRRSQKARKVRLLVRVDRHELVVPERMAWRQAEAFLISCHDWLRERDARLATRPPIDPSMIYWRGEPYQVTFSPAAARAPQFQEGAVGVRAHDPKEARETLERHLRREAIGLLTACVQHWAAIMNVQPTSLRFGDARQRWGSCNSRGGLNLNWRLAMTPAHCLDYVVVHELAHIRHMNHGPAFWAEVERFFPARREAEAWLKEHAHLILRRSEKSAADLRP